MSAPSMESFSDHNSALLFTSMLTTMLSDMVIRSPLSNKKLRFSERDPPQQWHRSPSSGRWLMQNSS